MTSVAHRPTLTETSPVRYLRGVGEARSALFTSAGIETVLDLLLLAPYRYEDRRHPVSIRDLRQADAPVTLRGLVVSCSRKTSPVKKLKIFEAVLDDGTGTIMLVWFNQPFLAEQIRRGTRIVVYGQPRLSSYGRLQIESPEFETLDADGESREEGAIVPVYSRISGIPPRVVRSLVQTALESLRSIEDPLPVELREKLQIIGFHEALIGLHRPVELDDQFLGGASPVHKCLILQEFVAFQLALRSRRSMEDDRAKPRTLTVNDALRSRVRDVLPFRLTAAQKRALGEIVTDMQSARPMYRLLQGDVGSGKTIVAVISAMLAIENGHQVALMAPTEILAEQHHQRIRQLLSAADVRVEKLTSAVRGTAREAVLRDLENGRIGLVVGTHALLQDPVGFRSLALAIVDEQHRFGVVQRRKLFSKGHVPDVLVMTATPIPRSLAIALYGDLDLSVIDELPPGRLPVKTVVRGSARMPRVLEFVDREVSAGARAYIVFPFIDESETLDVKALTSHYEAIRTALPRRRLAMLHGRMASEEKERTMRAFERGEAEVLVSTTIVEVGVDVPAASIMVVVDADRFGLSQLHQLRGRVGRGRRKSWCIVLRDETSSEEAKQRLRVFESTSDGFEVAEKDLSLRGAGDFLGTRQSGAARFRFGDVLRHQTLMELAREAAIEFVEARGPADALAIAERVGRGWSGEPSSRD